MCISEAALRLFLSLLSPEIVTETPAAITVHATEGDVIWEQVDGLWCSER